MLWTKYQLSWLRLHLSAPPLGMFLLAAISLPRETSELAALIPLCVLHASFGGLACALETHVQGILQCVVVHVFPLFYRFHVSRMPRMSFCCIQQNAPNQRLPQPDFGDQSDGTRSSQSTRMSSLGLDGLGDPHLCLCALASLGLHLAPEVLNNCGGSHCFTTKCELICSASNLCIDAARTWSCSSNQYLQFVFVHTQPSRLEHLRHHFSRPGKLAFPSENQKAHQVVPEAEVRQVQFPRGTTAMTLSDAVVFFRACVMLRAHRRTKHSGPQRFPFVLPS